MPTSSALKTRKNLQIALSNSLSWNFDGDCIESVDCFWQDSHFYEEHPKSRKFSNTWVETSGSWMLTK
jgi:hypothetical protein